MAAADDQLQLLVDAMPGPILVVDAVGGIVFANIGAEEVFGYDRNELTGRPVDILVPERFRDEHANLMRSFFAAPHRRPMGAGRRLLGIRKDRQEVPVEIGLSPFETDVGALTLASIITRWNRDVLPIRGESEMLSPPSAAVRWVHQSVEVERGEADGPVRSLGIIQDVTEARRLGDQLRLARKIDAIGHLAGGMAHDFNNLLSVIIGNLDLIPEVSSEASELIEEAIGAALRGADLTRSLLAFSGCQPLNAEVAAPGDIVSNAVKILRRAVGTNIDILLTIGSEVWPVFVDPPQLEACLVSLADNARDAMPRGGRLSIRIGNRYLDADHAAARAEVIPGDYVVIEVSDNGCGMSPDVVDRVFEPFFTTKGPGEGTGLGLSTVFGFIKQSGGHITIHSEPGLGTTFHLYLPRAMPEDTPAPADAPPDAALPPALGERILVVEDSAALRRLVVEQLTDLGYRTFEADGPAAALAILDREPVDLMFTDIVMPGSIDGFGMARQVMARWPDIKVVLTSGFTGTNLRNPLGQRRKGVRLISKPYRKGDLARMLREVFDA